MAILPRTMVTAAAIAALAARAGAQAPAPVPAVPSQAPEEDSGPGDPIAAASPPRPVVPGEVVPDVPSRPPERVAVMAFENRSKVRAVEWIIAGIPVELGEKIEGVLGMAPAWGTRWCRPRRRRWPRSAPAPAPAGC
jgi:hypothetical protein